MIPNLLVYHIVEFQDFSVAHILREINLLFLAILGALGFVHYKIHSLYRVAQCAKSLKSPTLS